MRDFRDAKAMARALRDALKAKAIETTHTEALELIAKAFGYENWNILSARIEAAERPAAATAPLPAEARHDPALLTFSPSLERSLRRAHALANERHHQYATLEHLLLALVDDQDAADVMRACNVDIDKLRRNMVTYVESELKGLVTDGAEDSKPTAGFQRVFQRVVIHARSSGREEVTGADVLVAIFHEREAPAVYFLQAQEMTRDDAVNYIRRGIKKGGGDTAI
jgi:Clp amino terminal domain, pathogenicity island component/Glyoxalase superfamily protein